MDHLGQKEMKTECITRNFISDKTTNNLHSNRFIKMPCNLLVRTDALCIRYAARSINFDT